MMLAARTKGDSSQPAGFVLTKLVVLLGLFPLGYFLFTLLGPSCGGAPVQMAITMVKDTGNKLEEYKLLHGDYPTQEQGLMALVTIPTSEPVPENYSPLYDELPRDPWAKEFQYLASGRIDPNKPEVISAGPDGQFETEDDISNQD